MSVKLKLFSGLEVCANKPKCGNSKWPFSPMQPMQSFLLISIVMPSVTTSGKIYGTMRGRPASEPEPNHGRSGGCCRGLPK